ncbi:maltose/glucose-specific PTS transporter subunit IIBC [Enterococcus sp. C50]|uniref:maltose/glucose-specific PTS transporter subunit IIBC n=1 Tax=Enterococcus sp. C50 TaxID=3231311 RepID=UPI0034A08020
MKIKFLQFIQKLGKSFMFPVSLLAFLGMFLGLGSSLASPSMIEKVPFLGNEAIHLFFQYMTTISNFAFANFPALFALSIPLGLAQKNKGVAAYSGFVGYMVMNLSTNFYLTATNQLAPLDALTANSQKVILGIQSLDTGIIGGIIVGILAYFVHERFQHTDLPAAFSFFSGERFSPIMVTVFSALLGLLLPFIWPLVSGGIRAIGHVIQGAGIFGPFFYGIGIMLLKPFGLHHILISTIRFTDVGGTQLVNGESVSGALNIFYSQLNQGLPISPEATAFLGQAWMPSFIFALPAIALAIYVCAAKDKRKGIKGLLISAALVSIFPGISEPVEFLFLFIALPLYIFHSLMFGLAAIAVSLIGVVIGNTDGGLIDYIIFGVMQGSYTKWWLIIPLGIVWFAIYFFTFRWYILKFDVKTPGREEDEVIEGFEDLPQVFTQEKGIHDPGIILRALGGAENIVSLDNCVTRLRLQVNEMDKINEKILKKAGALGIVKISDQSLQVIIGAKVQVVKDGIEDLLVGGKG